MKKALFAVAVVALLTVAAQAGEIKIHNWPCAFIPQEVATLKVTMDVGYWVQIKGQDKVIKLSQKGIHEYEGSYTYEVVTNTALTASCEVSATGAVPGKYSCALDDANLEKGTNWMKVTVNLTEANLSVTDGGKKDVHVANVKIKVVPTVVP